MSYNKRKRFITPGFLINICLFSHLSSYVESCSFQRSLQVSVPHTIAAGYVLSKVDMDRCQTETFDISSSDPDFTVKADGTIITSHTATVPANGRIFSLHYPDPSGQMAVMDVYLVRSTNEVENDGVLRRSKRRWSPIPFNIIENDVPPFPKDVELVGSDSSATYNVYYTVSGPGVDEHPRGLFSVDRNTGLLRVHQPVDREEFPKFTFQANVFDRVTNVQTDLPLPITVNVDDVNDNEPTFSGALQFSVPEQSKPGVAVGQVKATDRDQEGTDHTKIRYSLITGTDLFSIHPETGIISTVSSNLDREVKDTHFAIVEIRDMGGAPNGLFSTGTATIALGDVNDNPPTFTKSSYSLDVMENLGQRLLLRIPVEDKDQVNTPNWNSEFVITKGNENGNFKIERDPITNEGLLYLTKPLDYEATNNVKLEVMAKNQANLTGTTASWLSIPVDVNVGNEDEGPEFSAPTMRITVEENTSNGTLLGTYTASDPETKSSAGIKYYKVVDPGSWISVDENSGQLKVANTIDRESKYVQGGLYNVTMKAVDASGKTGSGMVILEVVDVNDHTPELPSAEMVVCEKIGELGSTLVVAEDKDGPPFSSPFSFQLGAKNDGKWAVKSFNGTAATLVQTKELPTNVYKVPLVVKDLQGMGEEQTVTIRVCRCRNGACVAPQTSTVLGGWGILAMLLPLALLALLCAVLAFVCMTKEENKEMDDMGDSGGILLKSNTEAPGDQLDSNLLIVPASATADKAGKGSMADAGFTVSLAKGGGLYAQQNLLHQSSGLLFSDSHNGFSPGQYNGGVQYGGGQFFTGDNLAMDNASYFHQLTDSAVNHSWQTNGHVLQKKLTYLGTMKEECYADDILHTYVFEGLGSQAGSVGCCSDQGNQDNLDFLNTLGPKFQTLAEACAKK
ncbi:desmocollin-3-like [Hypomesus transpacificus]|uniref:desmocollin-3-like n=1 Tax=Hypomesus transpacificus TaxID=137520 RepID=UPI001F07D2BC|nr:desmocollin-3-like [Hypomesus transpacificus]